VLFGRTPCPKSNAYHLVETKFPKVIFIFANCVPLVDLVTRDHGIVAIFLVDMR
jgi:hypothetical protein